MEVDAAPTGNNGTVTAPPGMSEADAIQWLIDNGHNVDGHTATVPPSPAPTPMPTVARCTAAPSSWLLHCEGSGKLDRDRSRLYRGQILQVNVRLKALAEIYTMHSFAQLSVISFFCQNFDIIFFQNFAK